MARRRGTDGERGKGTLIEVLERALDGGMRVVDPSVAAGGPISLDPDQRVTQDPGPEGGVQDVPPP